MTAPLLGRVTDCGHDRLVLRHNVDCLTTYLFGPAHVWADCTCGEAWRLKGEAEDGARLLKALHEQDAWGARFIQVLEAVGVTWASPGRETLAWTAYLPDGTIVGLLDPTEAGKGNSVARSWQYAVQVVNAEGDVLRDHRMYLAGPTALRLALAEVAALTADLAPLDHSLGMED